MEFVAINKLSLLDYPGKVACIIYTSACNFRCPYCHNGLTLVQGNPNILMFDDILAFLHKRIGILDGVVISGGEPTLMPDLKEKIREIKKLGFLVKLDTNGSNPEVVEDLIFEGLIDYVAMDIKAGPKGYPKATNTANVNVENIMKTIALLEKSEIDHEYRTTLVDEFIDTLEVINIGKMLKGAKKLYLQKYQLSEGVFNKNLHPVDEDIANNYKEILKSSIELVELRGY